MRQYAFGLAFLALLSNPMAAMADETAGDEAAGEEAPVGTDPDSQAIWRAIETQRAGDYDGTVSETNAVIIRFEKDREEGSSYFCAYNGAHAFAIMIRAALGEISNGVENTEIVSASICQAYFLKGIAQLDLGRPDLALPNLQAAVDMDPYSHHYLNELAGWYKADRQWDKSLELFTKASELEEPSDDPDWIDMQCRSLQGIGYVQIERRQWKAARTALNACLALIPGDEYSLNELEYLDHITGGLVRE